MHPLSIIQEEQRAWVAYNFGNRPAWMPLMGMCEELGELAISQRVRALEPTEEELDAIADCIIFAADFCSAMGWSLGQVWLEKERPSEMLFGADRTLLSCIGKLQHHYIKLAQGIRGSEEEHRLAMRTRLGNLLWVLAALTCPADWGANRDVLREAKVIHLVQTTWNQVKQRDWVKERAKKDSPT